MRAVLTYHSIDESGSPISIGAADFARHHRWFAARNVPVLPLDELLASPAGPDAIAITFDDGFRNTRDAIASLLADKIPVTVFVVAKHVGGTNAWGGKSEAGIPTAPLLDWDELGRLRDQGATIEAHTATHPHLPTLTEAGLDDELGGAQDELRSRLGSGVTKLSYPYGDLDSRVVGHARRFYSHGFTTVFRPIAQQDDALQTPRLDAYYFRHAGLEGWGSGRFDVNLGWIRLKRRIRSLLVR